MKKSTVISMENQVSIEFSPEEKQQINGAIETLESVLLQKLVMIPAEERKGLLKMGDKTKAFVEKALEVVNQEPALYQAFLDKEEFQRDVNCVKEIQGLDFRLAIIVEAMHSTSMLAGHEAYRAALTAYTLIQNAAKLGHPGAEDKARELGQRFPSSRRKKDETNS